MISQFLQSNLASWITQVFVIATVGASLPVLFRIRHPRTQLAYTHFVLAVCVFIPLMQPWRHAILSPDSHSGVTITYGPLILINGIHIPFGWDRIARTTGGLPGPLGAAELGGPGIITHRNLRPRRLQLRRAISSDPSAQFTAT